MLIIKLHPDIVCCAVVKNIISQRQNIFVFFFTEIEIATATATPAAAAIAPLHPLPANNVHPPRQSPQHNFNFPDVVQVPFRTC